MKKLSEYKDEEALDLLADLLEPCIELFSDKALWDAIQKDSRIKAVSMAIKNHKESVVQIMATLNGVPVEKFHYNVITLPKMVLEVLNDKELLGFFKSQGENAVETLSGSVTENTEDEQGISSNI